MGLGRYLPARVVRRLRPRPVDPLDGTICRAPFTSLHIDQFGDARPCCQSTLVLGNVTSRRVDEIWNGDVADSLRAAMRAGDLSRGCEHCAWAGREDAATIYARRFDDLRLADGGRHPTQLEVAPSNACNLQCTMCNGDWSSAIRLHREGRAALPRLFDRPVMEDLSTLLDRISQLQLFGGEPFLSRESLELLEEAARTDTAVTITTNGTILTDRVERLIDRPGVSIVLSIDGCSAETYESIRIGASWTDLLSNLERFREIASRNGNQVSVAHCLMTSNWWEFTRFIQWTAAEDLPVHVNDVLSPKEWSLHHLNPVELGWIVDQLTADLDAVGCLPPDHRDEWRGTVAKLEASLKDACRGERHAHIGPIQSPVEASNDGPHHDERRILPPSVVDAIQVPVRVELDLDPHLRVAGLTDHVPTMTALPIATAGDLIGRTSSAVETLLSGAPLQGETVRQWAEDVVVIERDLIVDGHPVTETRTSRRTGAGVSLRFDYQSAPTDEQLRRVIDEAGGVPAVRLDIDGQGTIVGIEEPARAQALGLVVSIGTACASASDVLAAERTDPGPQLAVFPVVPQVQELALRWPDGEQLVGLLRYHDDGVTVWLTEPAS